MLITETDNVVPNDVVCNTNGVLIYGANNSGKTVFLRSVGVNWLLFQAGLPIAAENAEMPIKTGFYSLFSADENSNADICGRFEGEVRNVKAYFDRITKDSLVLWNEPFQTTEYDEGGEALYYILNEITDKGAAWFTVTHIEKLIKLFEDKDYVTKLHFAEVYQIK